MERPQHQVRRQRFEVRVNREATALALQPHVASLNRRSWLPVIERVLDEFHRPGVHLRLDRLDLDLGTVPPASLERLEDEIARRLEPALRSALEAAVTNPESAPRAHGAAAARGEVLEYYLRSGHLPFGAAESAARFALDPLVAELTAADPEALIRRLRGLAQEPTALERLVRQLGEGTLAALTRRLEPRHAALILAYLAGLREVHRVERLVPLSDRELAVGLWLLTQTFLLRDPGTQFNRRSFVRRLLAGLAEREGLAYEDLLATLGRGLAQAGRRGPLASSLPGVVAALLRDHPSPTRLHQGPRPDSSRPISSAPGSSRPEGLRAYAGADAVRYFLTHGVLPWHTRLVGPPLDLAGLARELPRWPPGLLADALAAAPGGDRGTSLWRLARHLPEAEWGRWLSRLLPAGNDSEGSPLRASLATFAARAEDRGWFFARVVAALSAGEGLDFEALAAAPPQALAPWDLGDPATWPAHRLQSALVARLLGDAETAVPLPDAAPLLRHLARRSPADARHLLHHLEAAPAVGTAWLRESSAATLDDVARELYPRQLPVLRVLLAALARVPAPFRPRPEATVRAAVWGELWRREDGDELGSDFFAAVLGRLFAHPLAAPVARFLRRDAGRWALSGGLGNRQREAFLRALDEAGGEAPAPPPAPSPEPPAAARRRSELFAWLHGAASELAPSEIGHRLAEALVAAPVEAYEQLRAGLGDPRRREHWSRHLPEAALARLVTTFAPVQSRRLLDTAEVLFAAWTEGQSAESTLARREMWRVLLAYLAAPGRPDPAGLVRAFSEHLASLPGFAAGGAEEREARATAWLERASARAQAAGRPALAAALVRDRPAILSPWQGPRPGSPRPARERPEPARRPARKTPPAAGREEPAIYVANAGLVLLAPFLPRFFERLGLLVTLPPETADARPRVRFRDPEALSRGVHLLQYLVDGRLATPEPALVLNKLLCGAEPATPVDPEITAGDDELAIGDSLLGAVIAQWPAIAGTSVAGLRETFFVREGRLTPGDDGWRLLVQRRTVDFLVDEIPWSFRIILHPWMAQALHVTW
ncbi:MAG: contractile injection system tape measure protein [Thermoanaerobaculia bacterium]|nr:contractile injection system tape measure protein [Thermoanaerobaculia bacterium]